MKRRLKQILFTYFENKYVWNPDMSLRKEMFYRKIAAFIWTWKT